MKRIILTLLFIFSITSFAYAEIPTTPTNGKGEALNSAFITWSWDRVPDAKWYNIYEGNPNHPSYGRPLASINTFGNNTFTEGSSGRRLDPDTTYYLIVKAANEEGESEPLIISAKTLPSTIQEPPKSLDPTTGEPINEPIEKNIIEESTQTINQTQLEPQIIEEPVVIEPIVTYSFTDIESHWAKNYIVELTQKNIYSSTATRFYPNTAIKRGDFTKILITALDLPTYQYSGKFTDVSYSDSNAPYIQSAYNHGIIKGTSETTFEPDKTINRAEIATMFSMVLKLKNISIVNHKQLSDFRDYETFPTWATPYIQDVYSSGLVEGKTSLSDVIFDYQANTTNAENATLIYKLLDKLKML